MMDNKYHLTPQWRSNTATEKIIVGTAAIDARKPFPEYAEVRLDKTGQSAGVYKLEVKNNDLVDMHQGLRDNIRLNPNIAEQLGLPPDKDVLNRRNDTLDLYLSAGKSDYFECETVWIDPQGTAPEHLEEHLKQENYLLHHIDEVIETQSGTAEFTVLQTTPTHNTVQVTPNTEFNFVNSTRASEILSDKRQELRGGLEPEATQAQGADSSGDGDSEDDFSLTVKRPSELDTTFDDIAGLEQVKDRVNVVCKLADDSFEKSIKEQYGDLFVPEGGGNSVMLYGPPGCGKTMVSKAIANQFHKTLQPEKDVAFIKVKGNDILASLQGESEERMEKTFTRAKKEASQIGYCILFFDEIESLVQDRSDSGVQAHHQHLTTQFLQEMNDVGNNVMVIGATNLPFDIDSAATRRFKTEIFVPHPGEEGMAALWENELSSAKTTGNINYQRLARASANFTPSEISDRLIESEIQSELVQSEIDGERIPLNEDYFVDKIQNSEPQVIDRYVGQIADEFALDNLRGYEDLQEYVKEHA